MKCPYCNYQNSNLFSHIKEQHPKKLLYLEKNRPDLYTKLKKKFELVKSLQENRPNIFTLRVGNKKEHYEYRCIQCGTCCRNKYDIVIDKETLMNWIQAKRKDLLENVQIDPVSFAQGQLGLYDIEDKDQVDVAEAVRRREIIEKKIQEDPNFLDELSNFITENHDYIGEGESDFNVPNWFIPNVGYRAIFSPKSFKTVIEGWKRHLRYMTVMDLKGECEFLEKNLCSIHSLKPACCDEYPVKEELEKDSRAFEKFIKVCKGLKRIRFK